MKVEYFHSKLRKSHLNKPAQSIGNEANQISNTSKPIGLQSNKSFRNFHCGNVITLTSTQKGKSPKIEKIKDTSLKKLNQMVYNTTRSQAVTLNQTNQQRVKILESRISSTTSIRAYNTKEKKPITSQCINTWKTKNSNNLSSKQMSRSPKFNVKQADEPNTLKLRSPISKNIIEKGEKPGSNCIADVLNIASKGRNVVISRPNRNELLSLCPIQTTMNQVNCNRMNDTKEYKFNSVGIRRRPAFASSYVSSKKTSLDFNNKTLSKQISMEKVFSQSYYNTGNQIGFKSSSKKKDYDIIDFDRALQIAIIELNDKKANKYNKEKAAKEYTVENPIRLDLLGLKQIQKEEVDLKLSTRQYNADDSNSSFLESSIIDDLIVEDPNGYAYVFLKPPEGVSDYEDRNLNIMDLAKKPSNGLDHINSKDRSSNPNSTNTLYKTSNKQSINSSKGDKSTHRSKSPLKSKRHKELNKWILIDKGSHSKVYLVEKPRRLIIKKIQKQPLIEKNLLANVTREIQILPRLKHPFIAEFLSSYQTEDSIYIALEYYPNGDLADLLVSKRKISEESARFYICQVILALEYLHSMDIVYRDLKAENILIDEDGNTRLTDFGLSKEGVNRENLTRTICGTLAYLPPEVLSGKPYGKTVDWYLLGVLLYELIVGFPPFYNSDR